MKLPAGLSKPVVAVAVLAALYTAAHFAYSGVRYPLSVSNIGQIEVEIVPLLSFLEQGGSAPFVSDNPRQYGPVFVGIMHVLVRAVGPEPDRLAPWLYGLQLVCLALSFFFTWQVLRRWIPYAPSQRWWLLFALAFLWLNFAPAYTIIAGKNVEMWELCLLTGGLYAYVSDRKWLAAAAISAAAMIKLLPFVFFYFFLIRDRRTLVRAFVVLVIILLAGHAVYGQQLGLMYLPHVADASLVNTWALTFHENTSLKGVVVKLFGQVEGHFVVMSEDRMMVAKAVSVLAQLAGIAWLTWALTRRGFGNVPKPRAIWEWSLITAMLLILSPVTAFEWTTLTLGAFSYALFRLMTLPATDRRWATWALFAGAFILAGGIWPRQVLNRLVFIDAIIGWTGHTQFTPSEAYQFYGFTLLALFLLVATLWRLRDDVVPNLSGGSAL